VVVKHARTHVIESENARHPIQCHCAVSMCNKFSFRQHLCSSICTKLMPSLLSKLVLYIFLSESAANLSSQTFCLQVLDGVNVIQLRCNEIYPLQRPKRKVGATGGTIYNNCWVSCGGLVERGGKHNRARR